MPHFSCGPPTEAQRAAFGRIALLEHPLTASDPANENVDFDVRTANVGSFQGMRVDMGSPASGSVGMAGNALLFLIWIGANAGANAQRMARESKPEFRRALKILLAELKLTSPTNGLRRRFLQKARLATGTWISSGLASNSREQLLEMGYETAIQLDVTFVSGSSVDPMKRPYPIRFTMRIEVIRLADGQLLYTQTVGYEDPGRAFTLGQWAADGGSRLRTEIHRATEQAADLLADEVFLRYRMKVDG